MSSCKNHENDFIFVKGAKEHNLKNIDIKIPKNQLVVITGVSGSGKSSLAFDTIYVEGKRRYMNSLSTYTRHLEMNGKPDVEEIIGLSPTIAIEQKNSTRNPRSTVATATEVYDYLRVLFARIGIPHSPYTNNPISKHTSADIIKKITSLPLGKKICFVIPQQKHEKNDYRRSIINFKKNDCSHVIIDNIVHHMDDLPLLNNHDKHIIEGISKELTITGDMECKQMIIHQVHKCLNLGQGIMYVDVLDHDCPDFEFVKSLKIDDRKRFIFSEKYCCPVSGFQIDEIEPKIFSFNSPHGACRQCDGIGSENSFSKDLVIPRQNLSILDGAIAPWANLLSKTATVQQKKAYDKVLETLAKHYDFSLDTPFDQLSQKIQNVILYGSGNELISFTHGSKNFTQQFEGIIPMLEREIKENTMGYLVEELKKYQLNSECSSCHGSRLRTEALAVQIAGKNIGILCKMTILEMHEWFATLDSQLSSNHQQIAGKIIYEVMKRLNFLVEIGVGYLTLNRRSASLSGGESQRIKIASQLGCRLEGLIYVLDEPSIGLHQSDNEKLLNIMRNLCEIGNTVIVVEHDEETIRASDYLIDVGPSAGKNGGYIVASGTPEEVAKNELSITGQYLSGKLKIQLPLTRRSLQEDEEKYIEVIGATSFNLKNIDVKVPLECFVAITGVSGSGKSTFAIHTLCRSLVHTPKDASGKFQKINGAENIDKVIQVDQSPIGRTPRSNPITYINAFSMIRECFASIPEAKNLGYNTGCFSFNVKGGRCKHEGDGSIKIEMHFMPDVYIKCDSCNGMRYNNQILQVKYKGRSIADVLNMTADEAVSIFEDTPFVHEKLVALQDVGLGYLQLGQSATTLSGGEAQRIKLAKELSKRSVGKTLYILDEPTTGLHTHDVSKLMNVLHRLVDNGHSVVVIEHNLDVIKNADYIIDFGPFGGNLGGEVVATGTPEEVAQNENSLTGKYLRQYL